MDDLKSAMKSGNTTARDTIRYTMSSLKNARIDKGGTLTEQEEIAVLQRDAKRHQESIDQFRAAGRTDLVDKEEAAARRPEAISARRSSLTTKSLRSWPKRLPKQVYRVPKSSASSCPYSSRRLPVEQMANA